MNTLKTRKFGIAALISLAVIGIGWAAQYFYCEHRYHAAIKQAEGELQKGFPHLAWDTLSSYRARARKDPKACVLFLAAASANEEMNDLAWSLEACLLAGFTGAEPYLAAAQIRERKAGPEAAALLLNQVFPRFPKEKRIPQRIAELLREKNPTESAKFMVRAAEIDPNDHRLALEAMMLLGNQNQWAMAQKFSSSLSAAPTDDPQVKLWVARVLLHNDNKTGARDLRTQAETLMAKLPEPQQQALRNSYVDVFQEAPMPSQLKTTGAFPTGAAK